MAVGLASSLAAPSPSRGQGSPEPPAPELARCLQLINQGQWEAAGQRLGPLVKAFPTSARAHLLLGLTHHKQRQYLEARPWFARALALDPDDAPIRIYYGWCLYYLGESAEARTMFEEFLAVSEDYADAHFALGLLDFDADDLKGAAGRFARAIELAHKAKEREDEAKARVRLGDVYVRTAKLADARRELERAVELNPDLYSAYFKLAVVLERLGDAEGAEAARRKHAEVRERIHPNRGQAE